MSVTYPEMTVQFWNVNANRRNANRRPPAWKVPFGLFDLSSIFMLSNRRLGFSVGNFSGIFQSCLILN
jgi:hypothetical protein